MHLSSPDCKYAHSSAVHIKGVTHLPSVTLPTFPLCVLLAIRGILSMLAIIVLHGPGLPHAGGAWASSCSAARTLPASSSTSTPAFQHASRSPSALFAAYSASTAALRCRISLGHWLQKTDCSPQHASHSLSAYFGAHSALAASSSRHAAMIRCSGDVLQRTTAAPSALGGSYASPWL